ncbi:hypothetical protein PGTUg99_031211 [Puccinia graminis f. sp. tritici]|uniref:Concentrative nucleoside transporter C-terminal domain-containing protein n=1 Tax=Puccinia graminis f. sp. tritici TaxID=56615 RepID=A0A5B0LX68_PUCGR|nr:hypothetical protein PGTUg99_031211 [Puccinia graminis f. sp. tritici]
MGTPNQDVLKVSRLLAMKLITNEFVAYRELSKMRPEMTERGALIAIYGLCGFANLGSMGIQRAGEFYHQRTFSTSVLVKLTGLTSSYRRDDFLN